jgi:hypothetical protein
LFHTQPQTGNLARANIGEGALKATAGLFLYEPAHDNNYYNNPSTGNIRLCGTGATDTSPWEYAFGFTGRTMKTSPLYSHQLSTSTSARCTGWTAFFNPNIGGGSDFFFFRLTSDCSERGGWRVCYLSARQQQYADESHRDWRTKCHYR